MSESLNKAQIIGNLGRDPEVRVTGGGTPVCNFSVATTEKFKNSAGERQERTEWHDVVAWGKLGEVCGQYLSKGRKVYVEGRLQTREWDGKDGTKQRRKEIVASSVIFLGAGKGEAPAAEEHPNVAGARDLFGGEEAPF